MPGTATITAFYNFTANTKARATQVNTNFDTFRGHIIPVSPLTATSANNTYDLGSYEYKWRTGYFNSINFGQTSTATANIESATDTTTGEIVFKVAGNERGRLNSFGFFGTTPFGATNSAGSGQTAISSTTTAFATLSLTSGVFGTITASDSTVTIVTTGRPIFITVMGLTSGSADFQFIRTTTTGATIDLICRRGSSNLYAAIRATAQNTDSFNNIKYNAPFWIDFPSAGTYTYSIGALAGDVACSVSYNTHRLFAKEIF